MVTSTTNPSLFLSRLVHAELNEENVCHCASESIWQKVPTSTLEEKKIREYSIATGGALFGLAFLFPLLKKIYECGSFLSTDLPKAVQCSTEISAIASHPMNQMAYLCLGSLISLLSAGGYLLARHRFQDHNQEARYKELDHLYSKALSCLQEKADANALHAKLPWIKYNLIEELKLSELQADVIVARIHIAISSILQKQESKSSPLPIKKGWWPWTAG